MTYTALDNFYLTDEELHNSPSRNNGMDDATETTLRNYGCELIQVSCILLKLPQAAMATAQILFHRFYCKKSFKFFNVKKVAASCVWLASKLEECPKKARQVVIVFHRIERRKENLPIEHLDPLVKELKMEELNRIERHVLKELGFIGHAEHPHKLISSYLAALETPLKLGQQAWSLANDSLRTTLCVRFKSEVVACGVVYAAARRFRVPLPENPPWWEAFDANKAGIDEVCRVLAHLYSLPKARYIPVCKRWTSQIRRKFIRACPSREREALYIKSESERCKTKDREIDKDKDSRDREEAERDRSHRTNDRGHRSRDNRAKNHPYSEKSRHYSSRDRHNYHRSSYSSREKDRNRHHPPMPK